MKKNEGTKIEKQNDILITKILNMPQTIISLINLWCSKNLVDSQLLLGRFLASNQEDVVYSTDPYDPEVELVFLNTCGFISSGREEMFQTIKKLISHQKKVCVIWCAVQYFQKLQNPLGFAVSPLSGGDTRYTASSCSSNVSPWEGRGRTNVERTEEGFSEERGRRQTITQNPNISFLSRNDLKTTTISQILQQYKSQIFNDFERLENPRALTNIDNKFEYLKIAEGCNNNCPFCIIPKIRGGQKSLPIEKILSEVQMLVHEWAEEIILIAQDSTRYGIDLYGKPQLFQLLSQIEQLPWNFQYRLLYLYPDILTLNHLKKLTTFKKFIPYFDIPLQHISSSILKSMGRFYDEQAIYQFLDFIKENFKTSFIRTNFIIGFPGETEADFQQLQSFVQQDYFDNIALFEYHDEPLASSSQIPDKVPDTTIHKRFLTLRKLVNSLLLQRQQARKGKTFTGYIQEIHQENRQIFLSVRPSLHCPEVDELDDIQLSAILSSENEQLHIGSKITYTL